MKPLPSGRHAIVNATSRNYIRRKLIFGTFKTAKDVERHLDDLGMKISYSGCLKLLRSMDFQAEIKKKPFLSKKHMVQRLNWAKAHRSWTSDDWRRVHYQDSVQDYCDHVIIYFYILKNGLYYQKYHFKNVKF
jgi:hypothetical protein